MEYTEKELERLAQILFFRESIALGYALFDGVNLNIKLPCSDVSPLQFAANVCFQEKITGIYDNHIVLILLAMGADPNYAPGFELFRFRTPLELAIARNELREAETYMEFKWILEAGGIITPFIEESCKYRPKAKAILENYKMICAGGPPPLQFLIARELEYEKMREWVRSFPLKMI